MTKTAKLVELIDILCYKAQNGKDCESTYRQIMSEVNKIDNQLETVDRDKSSYAYHGCENMGN